MLESQHKSQHIKRWNQNTRKTPQNTLRSLLTRWPAIKIAGRMELKMINTPRGLAIWNQNLKQLWVRGALRVCSNKDDIAKSHSLIKDNNKSQSKKVGLSKQDIYNNSRVPRKTSPTNPDQLVKKLYTLSYWCNKSTVIPFNFSSNMFNFVTFLWLI